MKKGIDLILGTIILIIIGYLVMTPMGALRLALLRTGFPIKTITLQPTEETTQGVLENRILSKHEIFYV